MASVRQMNAKMRPSGSKGAARAERRAGRVPGVIYGDDKDPITISVDHAELKQRIYAGRFLTTIYELDVEGTKHRVIPRDFQLSVGIQKARVQAQGPFSIILGHHQIKHRVVHGVVSLIGVQGIIACPPRCFLRLVADLSGFASHRPEGYHGGTDVGAGEGQIFDGHSLT